MLETNNSILTGLAWCLAWGDKQAPQYDLSLLNQMRQSLNNNEAIPTELNFIAQQL